MRQSVSVQILNEASLIRDEMKQMTTEQISKEYERLHSVNPTSQRTILYSMELQTRKMLEKVPERAILR